MQRAIGREATGERGVTLAGRPIDELFAQLTRRHVDAAYRLAWAILQDDVDADDATQDAFGQAWRARRSLRDPDCFDAWFGRILVNVCRERLRQRARQRVRPLTPTDDLPVADASGHVSARDEIGRAVARLDPDHRIVVILRFWADLTVEDIAQRVGIAEGTVKSRLHHSMQLLRTALEESR